MLQPKDKDWLNRYQKKKKNPIYAVCKRSTSNLGHIQTEREGVEKDIS